MAGVVILVGSLVLTRLLSYSFLEAANSWALEMAMPQKGRYISSTWAEKRLQCLFKNTLNKYKQVWFCYYVHTQTHTRTLVKLLLLKDRKYIFLVPRLH